MRKKTYVIYVKQKLGQLYGKTSGLHSTFLYLYGSDTSLSSRTIDFETSEHNLNLINRSACFTLNICRMPPNNGVRLQIKATRIQANIFSAVSRPYLKIYFQIVLSIRIL